jgi:flagellar biosynthesis protein FlhF
MRIRTFTAPTMAEALRLVKAALGDDAVLLDTQSGADGVTVSAAVDDDPGVLPGLAPAGDPELLAEVRALTALVREMLEPAGDDDEARVLVRRLVAQGVERELAAGLVAAARGHAGDGEPLADALGRALPPAPPDGQRVQVVLGPPGEGKTTTLVQLAARARLDGRRVCLVGADAVRVGAAAELSAYGRVLDVPVVRAATPDAVAAAVASSDADVVLVDTPGAAPGQKDELDELATLADAAGKNARRLLVASATSAGAAVARTSAAFAPLAPHAAVLTRCDAASGAPSVAALWRAGVPIALLAHGRRIPGDLQPATPERLARCLLTV